MTTTFTGSDDLQAAQFVGADLHGARFIQADLTNVVMRGVEVHGADIDAPWLFDDDSALHINGIDVIPLVEAELNRQLPGRGDRRATTPEGLRDAWGRLQEAWAATLDRVDHMPAGTVAVSIRGEWSFTQTLRHLILTTDMWLGRAILELADPLHPVGLSSIEADNPSRGHPRADPSYPQVLAVRADRVAQMRDFLTHVTSEDLGSPRKNPWAPDYPETTLSCLHAILEEEWEHYRYAIRDLDTMARQRIPDMS